MSKAEERACQYTGYCKNQSYGDFLNGYHQAEKDLELSWEDIKLIIDIMDLENLKPHLFDEIDYQEVLNRFKNLKK